MQLLDRGSASVRLFGVDDGDAEYRPLFEQPDVPSEPSETLEPVLYVLHELLISTVP